MINTFRLHQRKLMLVIAILTIVAFVWLYNPTKLKDLGANAAYTIYDREITQADVQREANKYGVAIKLQQLDLIQDLTGMAQNENQMLNEFVWNLLVLQHEAKVLGVEPTDAQTAGRIRTLPAFQTDGQFDPRKYAQFVGEELGPRGFTERQLEGVIQDSLRLDLIKSVIGAPVSVSEAEVRDASRILQKVDVQTVSFPLEPARAAAAVTEDEIKNFYQQYQNSPMLVSPETRVVEFVEFAVPAGAKPLEGREKVEALQKLADAATTFIQKAGSTAFDQAASAAGLKVGKTSEFDRKGAARTETTNGPDLTAIAPAAFLLTEQATISDPIQAGEKFYVVKLATTNAQRTLLLDEARPLIEARIRLMKAGEILRATADDTLTKIREAMGAGKSFADAATAAGLKVETLKAVSPTGATPEQRALMRATLLMEPGQVSGLIPGLEGGFAVYLSARAPLDAAETARQKSEMEPAILEGKRRMLFVSWLASARDAAKIGQITHER